MGGGAAQSQPKESPLLAFRRRHRLTQSQAAKLVGIGPSTWRQIETGWTGRRPTASLLAHPAALDRLAGQPKAALQGPCGSRSGCRER